MSSIFFEIIQQIGELPEGPTQGVKIPQPGFIWGSKSNLNLQVRNYPCGPPPPIFFHHAKKLDLAERIFLVQSRASGRPSLSRYGHFRFQNGKHAKPTTLLIFCCGIRARTTHPPTYSDICQNVWKKYSTIRPLLFCGKLKMSEFQMSRLEMSGLAMSPL